MIDAVRSVLRSPAEAPVCSKRKLAPIFMPAVVAIAITLLAIDLPVPTGNSVSKLWASARHEDGHYLAFLISFAVISVAWSHHHDVFRFVRRVDPHLRQLNMGWLLMIILTPFATKSYALLEVLTTGLLLLMVRYMASHRLLEPDTPSDVTGVDWATYGMLLGFGLSIPVFFATENAWLLWFVMPLLFGRISARQRRRRRARKARS